MTYLYSKFYIKTIKKPYEYCNNRRRICGINCYGTFKSKGVQVTLVDKTTIIFSAAYLSSCYCFLEPSSISYPYRKFFAGKKIQFRLGKLLKVVPSEKKSYFIMENELRPPCFATVLKRVISEWKT
jgi:hypothetical protein